jgi:hypothetical protein
VAFVVLRQSMSIVQYVLFANTDAGVSTQMVKYASVLSKPRSRFLIVSGSFVQFVHHLFPVLSGDMFYSSDCYQNNEFVVSLLLWMQCCK